MQTVLVYREVIDSEERALIAEAVLRALPAWFGIEESTLEYIEGSKSRKMFGVFDSGDAGAYKCEAGNERPVAFVSLTEEYPLASEIYVMGCIPDMRGKGIGKKLVKLCADACVSRGARLLTVKTLSPRHPDAGYAETRMFYEAAGFFPYEENLDIWGTDNPCLFMAMIL